MRAHLYARILPALLLALLLAGCASAPEPQVSTGTHRSRYQVGRPSYQVAPYQINGVWYTPRVDYNYDVTGTASWYGPGFDRQPTSNGEIYDMNKMTAAHRTMAFGTIVKVTNLTNGKTAVVRITDRGPFIENRIIDLSMAAAKAIESIGPGVVPVRLEVISGSDPFGGIFTVQVGAFKEKGNAERLRARLDELYPPSTIQQVAMEDGTFYRVRAGKVSGERAAQKFADDLHSKEGFHTMVIRLDDAASGVEE